MTQKKQTKSKRKYRLIYLSMLVLALALVGVLAFAIYKLNTEFVPQQKEAQRFSQLSVIAHGDDAVSETDSSGNPVVGPDEQQNTIETTTTGAKIPHYTLEELFSMNSDMVGWLTIPDTVVDYPVMHTPDDIEYYLHTDFDGYYSFSGCLFVGNNCDIDSDMFVIYGHNMNNGSMFGSIDYYTSYDYWTSHPDVILKTKDETRLYHIFAAFATKVYDEDDDSGAFKYYYAVGDKTKEQYDQDVKDIIALSYFDSGIIPEYPAQIAYLSTCAYHDENGRFVLAAYRIG